MKGEIEMKSGEVEKEIEIEILEKDDSEEVDRDDLFAFRISEAEGGAKISKKDICYINIVSDKDII